MRYEAAGNYSDHRWYGSLVLNDDDDIQDAKGSKSSAAELQLRKFFNCQTEVLCLNETQRQVVICDAPSMKVIKVINECFYGLLNKDVVPLCLCTFAKGFIVGGSKGYIAIWERKDTAEYRFLRNVYTGKISDVVSIDVVTEDSIVASHEMQMYGENPDDVIQAGVSLAYLNGEVSYLDLASIYLAKDGVSDKMTDGLPDESGGVRNWTSENFNGHQGGIVSMSTTNSIQRPYVLTCSKDDAGLRLVNHVTREVEIGSYFSKEQAPVLCTMHPNGFTAAVAFADNVLRIVHIVVSHNRQQNLTNYATNSTQWEDADSSSSAVGGNGDAKLLTAQSGKGLNASK